mgnify:CR=1 FL=1|jgi:hypothetical protein|nr:MAG TPA: hypothetical protein [Caudoviricetes sp.]
MEIRDFDLQGFLRDKYRGEELVRLLNPKQCYFYMSQGVFPLWNEAGYNDRIVYVFLKEPTLRLFKKWREHDTQWEILQHEKRERQI